MEQEARLHTEEVLFSEICSRLGLENGLQDDSIPYPLVLAPHGDELDERLSSSLLSLVRTWLVGSDPTPGAAEIASRIRRIPNSRLLLVLYSLRLVARFHASTGRYWPHFRTHLLGDAIPLHRVHQRIAPELTRLWHRAGSLTAHSLHYPLEGRRHIKWPIAHAGLMPGDEAMLRGFVGTLKLQFGEEPEGAPLEPRDLDEFALLLLEWLEGASAGDSHVARLLAARSGVERIASELAQTWVRTHWQEVGTEEAAGRRNHGIRRRLVVDLQSRSIMVRLTARIPPGPAALAFTTPLDNSLNRSITFVRKGAWSVVDVQLHGPKWPRLAELRFGDSLVPFQMPAGIEGCCVFHPTTGESIRAWTLGTDYTVLLPEYLKENAEMETVFDDVVDVGPPVGDWPGYSLLWVHTRDPFATSEGDETEKLLELERAVEALGLPSFGHVWAPKLRLVGGQATSGDEAGRSLGTSAGMPWIELSGRWTAPIELDLLEERDDGRAVAIDHIAVEPGAGAEVLVELDKRSMADEAGRFSIRSSTGDAINLTLGEPSCVSAVPRFRVELALLSSDGCNIEMPTKSDLRRGVLVGSTWPLAQVELEISGETEEWLFPITASEEGDLQVRLAQLPIPELPAGAMEVALTWKGLCRSEIAVSDSPYIKPEDVVISVREEDNARILDVVGAMRGEPVDGRAHILLLGSEPWRGEIEAWRAELDEDRQFGVSHRLPAWECHWVLVVASGDSGMLLLDARALEAEAQGPATVARASSRLAAFRDSVWRQSSKAILRSPADPALRTLAEMGEFLDESTQMLEAETPSHGSFVLHSYDSLARLAMWLAAKQEPDLAIRRAGHPRAGAPVRPSHFVAPESCGAFLELCHGRQEKVSLAHVWPDGKVKQVGILECVQEEGRFAFHVSKCRSLCFCSHCGLLLEQGELLHHTCLAPQPATLTQPGMVLATDSGSYECWVHAFYSAEQLYVVVQELLARIHDVERVPDVPREWWKWLDRMESLFEQDTHGETARQWLEGVCSVTSAFMRLKANRDPSIDDVTALSRGFARYGKAVHLLHDWVLNDLQGGESACPA